MGYGSDSDSDDYVEVDMPPCEECRKKQEQHRKKVAKEIERRALEYAELERKRLLDRSPARAFCEDYFSLAMLAIGLLLMIYDIIIGHPEAPTGL